MNGETKVLIAVIRGLSHKLSLIRMMCESHKAHQIRQTFRPEQKLRELVAQLCNYEGGRGKSNN